MKQDFPRVSREKLCELFGKSRRAIYDYQQRLHAEQFNDDVVIELVLQIRKQLPRLGTRKLHYMLQPLLKEHKISIGRDELFELLQAHKLLIRQRKRKVITTDSRHWMRKYSNLSSCMKVTVPEQLWVSDITYIRLQNQWGYLSLITDAYSRKILGYCFRTDMSVLGCLQALQMALNNRQYPRQPLTHHSDRGSQYCSAAYVQLLKDNDIAISMTENGSPYENALAERVNGIIKNEFNLYESRFDFDATSNLITSSIDAYNYVRPHSSCNLLTPQQAHEQKEPLTQRWKDYPKKYMTYPADTGTNSKTEGARLNLTEQAPASVLQVTDQNNIFESAKQ
jgi:putative transposase